MTEEMVQQLLQTKGQTMVVAVVAAQPVLVETEPQLQVVMVAQVPRRLLQVLQRHMLVAVAVELIAVALLALGVPAVVVPVLIAQQLQPLVEPTLGAEAAEAV
jgi:hypothetical protein